MKPDLLVEEGGMAPTRGRTLWKQKKHFFKKNCSLARFLRPAEEWGPICTMHGCEGLCVSGFIFISMGWNEA